MTTYTYPILPAIDPTTGLPVRNSGGQVFAPDDTAFSTPLPVTDLSGIPITGNVIVTTSQGVTTQFRVEDQPVVVWKSGSYVIGLSSPQGMLDATTASQAAAEAAQAAAEDAASNAADAAAAFGAGAIPAGGASGQVLTKASNADRDVVWSNPTGGGGGGNVLVLSDVDEVPPGTLAGTVIVRIAGEIVVPETVSLLTGAGNVTTFGTSGPSNLVLSIPSAAAVGDVLIAYLGSQSSATGGEWGLPAGWTLQYSAGSGRRLGFATYPITDASALSALGSSVTFTIPDTTGTSRVCGAIQRATGVDLTTPVIGNAEQVAGTSSDISLSAFTSSESAGAVVTVIETNNSSGTAEPAVSVSGLTGVLSFNYVHAGGGQTGIFASMKATSGTSHPALSAVASPVSTGPMVGFQFALKGA